MNEWDLPEIGLRRLSSREIAAFWRGYADVAEPGLQHGSLYSRWRVLSDDIVLSLYVANRSVGLFVRGSRGERWATTVNRLAAYEPSLGKALGAGLRGYQGCCYLCNTPVAATDPSQWEGAYDWLKHREGHYRGVLEKLAQA
jgi:hypothetical protein